MKMFKLNSRSAQRMVTTVALGLLLGAQTAMACTVGNWIGGNSGNVTAGGPSSDNIARYSGICAMETADTATSWVQDDSPGGIDRIRARFYVLADNSSEAVVYRGLTSTGSLILGVRLNPASGDVTLTSAGANAVCSGCADAGAWNSIEIDWNADGGSLDLWVNSDAKSVPADATASFSTTNTVSAVRLGNLNDAAGTMNFDGYESRRTTEIGRLCKGETTGDGDRTSDDFLEIFDEVASAGGVLSSGQPDFTEDGFITNDDVLGVFDLVAGAAGECP